MCIARSRCSCQITCIYMYTRKHRRSLGASNRQQRWHVLLLVVAVLVVEEKPSLQFVNKKMERK